MWLIVVAILIVLLVQVYSDAHSQELPKLPYNSVLMVSWGQPDGIYPDFYELINESTEYVWADTVRIENWYIRYTEPDTNIAFFRLRQKYGQGMIYMESCMWNPDSSAVGVRSVESNYFYFHVTIGPPQIYYLDLTEGSLDTVEVN